MALSNQLKTRLSAIDDMSEGLHSDNENLAVLKRLKDLMTLFDELSEAINSGDELAALILLCKLPSELDSQYDLQEETWELFETALDSHMPEVALAMMEGDKVHGADWVWVADMIGASDRPEAVPVFAKALGRGLLGRCAYHARCEHGEGSRTELEALRLARTMLAAEWAEAMADGLETRWARRVPTRYEKACQENGVPVWSAISATCMADRAARELDRLNKGGESKFVEEAAHHGSAMDLPEDFLLWSQEAVDALSRESARRADDILWNSPLLDSTLDGWRSAKAALPRLEKAMEAARSGRSKSELEAICQTLCSQGASRWLPFMAAWGQHKGFSESDKEALSPLLERSTVDAGNVGLMAANMEYGSFNGRIALIAIHLRQIGRMDDASVLVLRARIEDLWADPVMGKFMADISFANDFSKARGFFASEADRIELERSARPSASKRKALGL